MSQSAVGNPYGHGLPTQSSPSVAAMAARKKELSISQISCLLGYWAHGLVRTAGETFAIGGTGGGGFDQTYSTKMF